MSETKKVRGSTATYKVGDDAFMVDLHELAQFYSNYGNVPKHMNDTRAAEIAELAKAYLRQVSG